MKTLTGLKIALSALSAFIQGISFFYEEGWTGLKDSSWFVLALQALGFIFDFIPVVSACHNECEESSRNFSEEYCQLRDILGSAITKGCGCIIFLVWHHKSQFNECCILSIISTVCSIFNVCLICYSNMADDKVKPKYKLTV